jgi:GDSL/SGNH-like Acyl-Esterase family found in Pmr5 and Cas1p
MVSFISLVGALFLVDIDLSLRHLAQSTTSLQQQNKSLRQAYDENTAPILRQSKRVGLDSATAWYRTMATTTTNGRTLHAQYSAPTTTALAHTTSIAAPNDMERSVRVVNSSNPYPSAEAALDPQVAETDTDSMMIEPEKQPLGNVTASGEPIRDPQVAVTDTAMADTGSMAEPNQQTLISTNTSFSESTLNSQVATADSYSVAEAKQQPLEIADPPPGEVSLDPQVPGTNTSNMTEPVPQPSDNPNPSPSDANSDHQVATAGTNLAFTEATVDPKQQDSPKNHYSNTGVLDLFPWEYYAYAALAQPGANESTVTGTCQPPPGIPTTCCAGTFSIGGGLTDAMSFRCIPAMEHFPFLRHTAFQWFEENNVPSTKQECDICEIVEIARRNNLTISFVGDSMQHQVFDGFTCELHRRGYSVTLQDAVYPLTHENFYQQAHRNKTLTIRSPQWSPDHDQPAIIQYHQMYRLPSLNDNLEKIIQEADVLVTNFGLHWMYEGQRDDYVVQMTDLFRNITAQGRVKLLMHRETSAQHWHADGGEYSLW